MTLSGFRRWSIKKFLNPRIFDATIKGASGPSKPIRYFFPLTDSDDLINKEYRLLSSGSGVYLSKYLSRFDQSVREGLPGCPIVEPVPSRSHMQPHSSISSRGNFFQFSYLGSLAHSGVSHSKTEK